MIYSALLAIPIALAAIKSDTLPTQVTLNIDISKTYQTIDNFGASDAWSCQFVGNWPDAKRNKVADLLFSRDTMANGSPKGIALSLWRFNIGAGSAEQKGKSGIKDDWRRAGSLINADGNFDAEKQAGQVWFLKAAKARGVSQFLGFCNSPPVQYTLNKKAYADKGKANIAPNQYPAFASFLTKVTKGLEETAGIKLSYISPVNEPQWDWSDGGQEGSPYNNAEIAGLFRVIGDQFKANNITTKLMAADAASIAYLYTAGDKKGKGNQIADFFKPQSANYIGDVHGIAPVIAGHSYFTTSPASTAGNMRKALAGAIAKIPGLGFWQSEYCVLGDNAGEISGNKRDLNMNAALYLARVIHTDLTVANATAWQWWTAVSAYNYKDGLVYVDKNKTDGNVYSSKMLWAMGNYSRFVESGAIRVSATIKAKPDLKKPLLVSAYKHNKNVVVVIVNENTQALSVDLGTTLNNITFSKSYTTDQRGELTASQISNNHIAIPARSVITLTGVTK